MEFSEAANNMIQKFDINPFRPDREEINPNFYFRNSLWCASKGFIKALKAFIKPLKAPQGSAKLNTYVNVRNEVFVARRSAKKPQKNLPNNSGARVKTN